MLRPVSLYITCLVFLLIGQTTAQFLLDYPPSIGYNGTLGLEAFCGGFDLDSSKDNITDFYVGGDAIALTSLRPQSTWIIVAQIRNKIRNDLQDGPYWIILPAIQQTGIGHYCNLDVAVNSSWVGSEGAIMIQQVSDDVIPDQWQCTTLNFVPGARTRATLPSACKNDTGVSARFTKYPSWLVNGTDDTSNSTSSATAFRDSGYILMGSLLWISLVCYAGFVVIF